LRLFRSWHTQVEVWKQSSVNRKILSSTLTIAGATLLVKFASIVKEMLIADRFGTGDDLDAFLIAFLLPQFLVNVIAGSFAATIVPSLIISTEKDGLIATRRLMRECLLLVFLLLSGSAIFLALAMPLLLPLLSSGFSVQKYALSGQLYMLLLPVIIVNGMAVFYGAVLNSQNKFWLPSVLPAITPFAIILVLLQFVTNIYGVAWGMLAGCVIELMFIILVLHRSGWPVLPRWHGMLPSTQLAIRQYTPMIAGTFMVSGATIINQAMAATLEPGSVSALNYGNKVFALVSGLGAGALGTAVLPFFSKQVAQGDWAGARHTLGRYTRLLLYITIPTTVFCIIFSEWIIRILFEHGLFNAQDTRMVALVQSAYFVQIPFYLLGILGARMLNAMQSNQVLLKIALVSLIANVMGNWLLMKIMGVAGIALSTSIAYLLSCAMIFYSLRRTLVAKG